METTALVTPLSSSLLFCFLLNLWFRSSSLNRLCEVFGNRFYEVGRRHEDGEGADDGEQRESHQAEPVHHRCGELPLAADGLRLILVAEALRYVRHLLQDALDLREGNSHAHPPSDSQPPDAAHPSRWLGLIGGRAVGASAQSYPRVTRGWAVRAVVYWVVIGEVQVHGAVGGARLAGGLREGHAEARNGTHLYGGGAGVVLGGVAVLVRAPLALIAGLLHAQEPGAPVQQNHSHLEGDASLMKNCKKRQNELCNMGNMSYGIAS